MEEKIRAKAKTLADDVLVIPWTELVAHFEAALAEVGNAAWKEGVEAAETAVNKLPHQQYYHAVKKAIRSLKRSKA